MSGGKKASQRVTSLRLVRWQAGLPADDRTDLVAREEPLEIRVRGRSVAVTMRTPGHDAELAAGFLLSENVVRQRSDILTIATCPAASDPENTLNVFLAPNVRISFKNLTRHVFASSSCGLCGKASIEAVHQTFPPIANPVKVRASVLARLPQIMRAGQDTFEETGGLHAAALFTLSGKLMVLREDIGRHNAVDKVLGWALLRGSAKLKDSILLVSGRASFEIMQKALAARVSLVCAISAPSSLAVDFARQSGQTLVGFLRGETMNIYSSPDRVLGLGPARETAPFQRQKI